MAIPSSTIYYNFSADCINSNYIGFSGREGNISLSYGFLNYSFYFSSVSGCITNCTGVPSEISGCFKFISSATTPTYPVYTALTLNLLSGSYPTTSGCLDVHPCPVEQEFTYFKYCCPQNKEPKDDYFSILTDPGIFQLGQVYLIGVSSISACASVVSSDGVPEGISIYQNIPYSYDSYATCQICTGTTIGCAAKPQPTPTIFFTSDTRCGDNILKRNECDPIVLFPLGVSCVGNDPTVTTEANGELSLIITGGTPPYDVFWSNGSNGLFITNLSVGTYSAIVTDYYRDFTAYTTCVLTAPSPPPTPPPTPTPTPTGCVQYTVDATPPTNLVTLRDVSNGAYSILGTRFHSTFEFNGASPGDIPPYTSSNAYLSVTPLVWISNNSSSQGPMNRSAVWVDASIDGSAFENVWLGFTKCVNAPETKTYWVGLGADNNFRFVVDGVAFVDTQSGSMGASSQGITFKYWHIYPIDLTAGSHIIELYGLDVGGIAGFGCEIYNNTLSELTGAITVNDLDIIFSSRESDYITVSQDLVGNYTDYGFTCPEGFLYQSCENNCIGPTDCQPSEEPDAPFCLTITTDDYIPLTYQYYFYQTSNVVNGRPEYTDGDGHTIIWNLGDPSYWSLENPPGEYAIITYEVPNPPLNGWQFAEGPSGTITSNVGQCPGYPNLCLNFRQIKDSTSPVYSAQQTMVYNGMINGRPSWLSLDGLYTISWNNLGYWQVVTAQPLWFPMVSYNTQIPPISNWNVPGTSPDSFITVTQGNCTPNAIATAEAGTGFGNTGPLTNEPTENPALRSSTSYNGNILLRATSGTGPFQYSIDGGLTYRTIPLFTKLSPGTYSTVIKDVSGRTTFSTVVLSEPPSPVIYQVSLQTQSTKQRNNSTIYTSTIKTSPALPSGVTITFDLVHTNTFRSSTTTTAATMTNSTLMKRNGRNFSANTTTTVTSTTLNTLAGCQDKTIYITGKTETWTSVSYTSATTLSFETTTLITKNLIDKCYVGEATDSFVITNLTISGCSSCGVVNGTV